MCNFKIASSTIPYTRVSLFSSSTFKKNYVTVTQNPQIKPFITDSGCIITKTEVVVSSFEVRLHFPENHQRADEYH